VGFVSFLMLLGLTITRGAQVFRRVKDDRLKPFLLSSLAFVTMYTVYSYVDQGWDYKGMVFLGAVLGCFAVVETKLLNDTDRSVGEGSCRIAPPVATPVRTNPRSGA
jgi:hypothetical protein